ncbi:hypothetical protein D3C81_1785170 [compost metagenome]
MRQLRQIAHSADILKLSLVLQSGRQCNQVNRLALFSELHHRLKNHLMRFIVEVFGIHPLHSGNQRFILQEHSTDYGLFRLQVLRGNPIEKEISTHLTPPLPEP